MIHGAGWSTAFLVVTRLSAIVAVPIVLHRLGADLYTVWVLAGALVMIQSLFDLGVASALVRYVAVAAADGGGRASVVSIARRAAIFYGLLSLAVALPMWFGASEIARFVHFLRPAELTSAVVILRWAAVAFVLTNAVLVAAAVLQGIDRVGASYRDQTVGWLLYLPLLTLGMSLWSGAEAVGAAWVGAYAAQMLLLARSLTRGVRLLTRSPARVPGYREMLSFGGRWQVSAWADFATFQLPRFIAGAALTSGDVVSLDVSLRAGQLVVSPLFAFYPTVLPAAAALLARGGASALRSFLERFYPAVIVAVVAGVCLVVPLEVPALALWTGRASAAFNPLVVAAVLIGTAAHAATGLLSSALLARGDVRPVIVYKARQLVLAAILLAAAAPIGLVAVAFALAFSLVLPALAFNHRAAAELGLDRSTIATPARRVLALVLVPQVAIPIAVFLLLESSVEPWLLLLAVAATALICLAVESALLFGWASKRGYARPLGWWRAAGAAASNADHLLRK